MLHYFRPNPSSLLWRAVNIVSAVFVFSYILFDVLDLDLSDFPLRQAPLERTAVVTQVSKGTEHTFLPDRTDFWVDLSLLFSDISKESLRLRHKGILRSLQFDSARTCVYRIGLPRSSTKDSSPSAWPFLLFLKIQRGILPGFWADAGFSGTPRNNGEIKRKKTYHKENVT